MDLEQLRNFSFIGTPISIFFLIVSIVAFSNGEIGGIMFLFGAIIFTLPLISYFCLKKRISKEKEAKRTQDNLMRTMAQLETVRIQMEIEKLNDDYCLGLYEGDIFAIAEAAEPLKILQHRIEPGKPTVEECEANFKKTLHMLLHGIELPKEEAEQIENELIPEIVFDQKLVDDYATLWSENLSPEMSFLHGKINYMVGILALLEGYAEENNHEFIRNKVQEISKNRGYTL